MKVINFYNVKGGTGKSSLSYLTGMVLSEKNRVLFIDIDPQASLTHRILSDRPKRTMFNFIAESESISACIQNVSDRISIIPSELKLNRVMSGVLENTFKKFLKNLKFDFVIIDNPPSWNSLVISGLSVSDKIFIPTLLSQNDLDSAEFTLKEVMEMNDKANPSIILNRTAKKESKEEKDYILSYKFLCPILRLPNMTGLKRVIDRGESVESKKNLNLKDSVLSLLKSAEVDL